MLTCLAAGAAEASLAAGSLTCPSCGTGRLARWGHGREREVTLLGGKRVTVRPRRARCTACDVTHLIVPAWCAPRRAHALEVIGTAAAAALAGSGHRAIGAGLGVPADTVRGWLRRLRSRAEELRCHALGELAVFGGDRCDHLLPSGSPLGDALTALTAVVRAVQRRLPGYGGPGLIWPLLGQLGLAAHLTPARGG